MIPDVLPLLRRGAGPFPKDGGCLVQVASYLHDGLSWKDRPECVDPLLASIGIRVNDMVSNAYRPRLAPLAAELVGTGPAPDGAFETVRLHLRLAVWACRRVQHLMPDDRSVEAVDAAEAWANCPCDGHRWQTRAALREAQTAVQNAAASTKAGRRGSLAALRAATTAMSVGHAVNNFGDAEPVAAVDAAVDAASAAAYETYHCNHPRDEAAHAFLAGLIAEHRRLTGRTETGWRDDRYQHVCELIGAIPALTK